MVQISSPNLLAGRVGAVFLEMHGEVNKYSKSRSPERVELLGEFGLEYDII